MGIAEDVAASVAPDGRAYALPDEAAGRAEARLVERWAVAGRRPVVVVQGAGFVGAAMAVAVAAARDQAGRPRYSVVCVDRPAPESFWKCRRANEGVSPIETSDAGLLEAHRAAVLGERNLRFTWVEEAYALAEVLVVDVNVDVVQRGGATGVDLGPLEAAIGALGRHMQADALVLVESTVPPGTCASLVVPRLREAFAGRGLHGEPLVAHSYERVMPGPGYLASITQMWRVYAGSSEVAAARAGAFLASVIDTERYPATRVADTTTSELAKVLENSYRATNIALVQEWGRLAERAGVDLYAAIEAIRLRRGTHDNLRYPGFGVGGYCLTKDALLADWAARHAFGMAEGLPFATQALRINDAMPRHVFGHLKALLGDLRGKRVALLGVSYLPGVADTRSTPAQPFCDLVEAAGGEVLACDPMLARWDARRVFGTPLEAPAPLDAAVFAVAHPQFRALEPEALVRHAGRALALVDGHHVLEDATLHRYRALGCKVSAVGRGHLR